MIYETKGLTLEQIDELYAEVKTASQSPAWKPTTTFREIRASLAAQGGRTPGVGPYGAEVQPGQDGEGDSEKAATGYSTEHHA